MMKLQAGDTYVSRDSQEVVTVTSRTDGGIFSDVFPFEGDNGLFYMADGRYIDDVDMPANQYDLVLKLEEGRR